MMKPNQFGDCVSHHKVFSLYREIENNSSFLRFLGDIGTTKKYHEIGTDSCLVGQLAHLELKKHHNLKITIRKEKKALAMRTLKVV